MTTRNFSTNEVRSMISEAVPAWVKRGNAVEEWEAILSHPKTAPALEELAANEELFVGFFISIIEGDVPPPPRFPEQMSFREIFNTRDDDQLHGFADASYVLWQMAAKLLLRYRAQNNSSRPRQ